MAPTVELRSFWGLWPVFLHPGVRPGLLMQLFISGARQTPPHAINVAFFTAVKAFPSELELRNF